MAAKESVNSGPTLPPFAILAIEHNGFLELSRPKRRPFGLRYPWLVKPAAEPEAASDDAGRDDMRHATRPLDPGRDRI